MLHGTMTAATYVEYSMTYNVVMPLVCEIVSLMVQMFHDVPVVMKFAIWISACTG